MCALDGLIHPCRGEKDELKDDCGGRTNRVERIKVKNGRSGDSNMSEKQEIIRN